VRISLGRDSERTEDDFIGIVDLLTRKSHIWPDPGNPDKFEIGDVPADMVDEVEEYRSL
jgi:elongation factor G